MPRIGYTRVSTTDQHPEAQAARLVEQGCTQVFTDRGVTGKLASRHMIYMAAKPVRGTPFVGDESEPAEVRWASQAEAERLMPDMFGPVRDYLAKTIGKGA